MHADTSAVSRASLVSANSASVVVVFINCLLGEHSTALSIKNIGKMGDGGDGRANRKDRFHLEVEAESICLRVSDRTVPPTLSSLEESDLLHHVPTNSCCTSLLFLIATLCPIKTHTNKYKTHHTAQALSVH